MKAEIEQIPGTKGQIDTSNKAPHNKGADALWSHIRRLMLQVKSMELALSTVRRDINRIDRNQYRAKENSPPSEIPGNGKPTEYSPALFG